MTLEEKARIRNLNADTALKIAQLRTEKVKAMATLFASIAAVFGTVLAIIKALI